MPVIINRSTPGDNGNTPDKNSGNKPKSAKPASKAARSKKAKAGPDSPLDDPRVKIGLLVGLLALAAVAVMFAMGMFSGPEAPAITAPPPTSGAPAGGNSGAAGAGLRSRGPGSGAGVPVPGSPGEDASPGSGAQIPPGRL